MRNVARLIGAGALFAMVMAGPAAHAKSINQATFCTDTLDPGTYKTVVVPEDAVCISDGPVTIKAGLFVADGATFVLGSEDNPVDTGTISGGVHAINPMNLQIHFTTIDGGLVSFGGSGPDGGPFGITWNAIEDNTINGGVVIEGYDGFWMGFIRNDVRGSVNLNGNVLVDPDGNEYVTNTIHGNMNCADNSPAPQIGDSGGEPNVVTGRKTGQCEEV
jgi:hypothetical protein